MRIARADRQRAEIRFGKAALIACDNHVLSPLIGTARHPTGAHDDQFPLARRQRGLEQQVVRERRPALHQVRMTRKRGEHVQQFAMLEPARAKQHVADVGLQLVRGQRPDAW